MTLHRSARKRAGGGASIINYSLGETPLMRKDLELYGHLREGVHKGEMASQHPPETSAHSVEKALALTFLLSDWFPFVRVGFVRT